MKQFSCGAVVPGCQRQFRCVSEAELLAQVTVHARDDHGLEALPPALVRQVREQIVSFAA